MRVNCEMAQINNLKKGMQEKQQNRQEQQKLLILQRGEISEV